MQHATRFAAAVLGMLSLPAQAVDLFTNGSFEAPVASYLAVPGASGAITGWTTVFSGVELFNPASFGLNAAPDGAQVVDLANFTFSAGGLEQAIATVMGQSYTVSFSAGNSLYGLRTGTGVVKVSIDGGAPLLFNTAVGTSATSIDWETRSFNFVAAGASSTIRFFNDQNANVHFAFIDGASVQAVPEPGAWALMLAGLVATTAAARRRVSPAG